mgnify:CR=1 FL=1
MVDNKDLTVNFLPSPTWNRLGVNRAKIRNIPVDGWNSIPVQKEIIEKIYKQFRFGNLEFICKYSDRYGRGD